MLPTCGEPTCELVEATGLGTITLLNPDALDCALTALRDRTPGLLRWSQQEGRDTFLSAGYVLIHADGTAVRRGWFRTNLYYGADRAEHVELPDPCAFEQCLAAAEAHERLNCLREFPAVSLATCDESWLGDLF